MIRRRDTATLSLVSISLMGSAMVVAHQQTDSNTGTVSGGPLTHGTLSMSAAITAHTGDSPNSRDYPAGVLVSDEASYEDSGLSLQAWSASFAQPLSHTSWASVGVGTHGAHGGATDHAPSIEIEELTLSYHHKSKGGIASLFVLGQQSVAPQPWLNWHADTGVEAVPSLIADVYLARHRLDTGLSGKILMGNTQLGVNLWNGDAWPATAGEGAIDLTIDHGTTFNEVAVDVGVFLTTAKAADRGGEDSSHSHDSEEVAPVFSGDTHLAGTSLGLSSDSHSRYLWSLHAAFLSSRESGDLTLDAQQSEIVSDSQAVRLYGQIEQAGRGIWLRHEWLSIDNRMGGPGGQAMAESAGIADLQGRPSRTVLGSWWDALPGVRWQLAVQREYDGLDDGWSAWLGVKWSQQWEF